MLALLSAAKDLPKGWERGAFRRQLVRLLNQDLLPSPKSRPGFTLLAWLVAKVADLFPFSLACRQARGFVGVLTPRGPF